MSHGPADGAQTLHDADAGHGHGGHGAWHGPHESPRSMTFALVVLAVGAVLAGFVGVPAVLGGSNQIEHFLHPSFAPPSLEAHSGGATDGRPAEVASLRLTRAALRRAGPLRSPRWRRLGRSYGGQAR